MAILSKSKIIAFRQCPKRLWLEIHKPELREDSAATQAVFRVGNQVGEIARKLYDTEGDGVTIDAQRDGYPKAYAQTDEFLAKADRPIFEAGLRIKGALAFADVLIPSTRGRTTSWTMVEVKSSGSVKDYHLDDIAVQSHIATASGINLKTVSLACIDTSWVYPGDGDYQGLLYETDLTQEALSRGDEAAGWISEAQKVAAMPSEPKIDMGDHCHDPFECGFCNYCNRGLKQPEFPVDWLPSLHAKRRARLLAQGIDDLRHVPDEELNERQQLVRDHTIAGTTYFDAAGAAADLARHKLPACFLDFETVNLAVPIWKGTRPYQQVPFQFSLHKVDAKGALVPRVLSRPVRRRPLAPLRKGPDCRLRREGAHLRLQCHLRKIPDPGPRQALPEAQEVPRGARRPHRRPASDRPGALLPSLPARKLEHQGCAARGRA